MSQDEAEAEITKLRRDVDVLTGLVVALVGAAEMRTRVAVRNHNAVAEAGSMLMSALAVNALGFEQAQLLRLQQQDTSQLTGGVLMGYNELVARLSDALGPHAMPVMDLAANAA